MVASVVEDLLSRNSIIACVHSLRGRYVDIFSILRCGACRERDIGRSFSLGRAAASAMVLFLRFSPLYPVRDTLDR